MSHFIQTSIASPPRARPAQPRRGVALLMVLAAVLVAAIVSYAVLQSASMSVQAKREQGKAWQSSVAAEDGARLAMHYLLRPGEANPAQLSAGLGSVAYWGGASSLKLGVGNGAANSGLADVSVANPSAHVYQITSLAKDANGGTQRVVARVRGVQDSWQPFAAFQSNAANVSTARFTVTGDVWTKAAWSGGGAVSGTVYQNGNKPAGAAGDPVPAFDDLALVKAGMGDGWYTYNGVSCRGDFITVADLKTMPIANAQNAGRVFFYKMDGHLDLSLASPAFSGTLVVLTEYLHVKGGSCYITPQPGMPALLVRGDVHMDGANELRGIGLVYVGGVVRDGSSTGMFRVRGALLHGGPAYSFTDQGSGAFKTRGIIEFDAAKAAVPNLLEGAAGYKSLVVESWERS